VQQFGDEAVKHFLQHHQEHLALEAERLRLVENNK
jgi:hypothetical protein